MRCSPRRSSADLLPGERTRLHLALAEALAADPGLAAEPAGNAAAELAFHWRACHRLEEALTASVEAGLQAESSYAFAEANRHFENALELWDRVDDAERRAGHGSPRGPCSAPRRTRASTARHSVRWRSRDRRSTRRIADEIRPARGLARERLGEFLWLAGDSDGALEALREAVDLLPAEPPSVERARVLAARGAGS